MPVLSLVTARIAPDRREDVVGAYRLALDGGLPPPIRQTFLLLGEDETVAIATVWRSREGLDAMLASGEEPLARRLLREAGGDPAASFFEIADESGSGSTA